MVSVVRRFIAQVICFEKTPLLLGSSVSTWIAASTHLSQGDSSSTNAERSRNLNKIDCHCGQKYWSDSKIVTSSDTKKRSRTCRNHTQRCTRDPNGKVQGYERSGTFHFTIQRRDCCCWYCGRSFGIKDDLFLLSLFCIQMYSFQSPPARTKSPPAPTKNPMETRRVEFQMTGIKPSASLLPSVSAPAHSWSATPSNVTGNLPPAHLTETKTHAAGKVAATATDSKAPSSPNGCPPINYKSDNAYEDRQQAVVTVSILPSYSFHAIILSCHQSTCDIHTPSIHRTDKEVSRWFVSTLNRFVELETNIRQSFTAAISCNTDLGIHKVLFSCVYSMQ